MMPLSSNIVVHKCSPTINVISGVISGLEIDINSIDYTMKWSCGSRSLLHNMHGQNLVASRLYLLP